MSLADTTRGDLELERLLDLYNGRKAGVDDETYVFRSPMGYSWCIYARCNDEALLTALRAAGNWQVFCDLREKIPGPHNPGSWILRESWPVYTDHPGCVRAGEALSAYLVSKLAEKRDKEQHAVEDGPLPTWINAGAHAASESIDKASEELRAVMDGVSAPEASRQINKTVEEICASADQAKLKATRDLMEASERISKLAEISRQLSEPEPQQVTIITAGSTNPTPIWVPQPMLADAARSLNALVGYGAQDLVCEHEQAPVMCSRHVDKDFGTLAPVVTAEDKDLAELMANPPASVVEERPLTPEEDREISRKLTDYNVSLLKAGAPAPKAIYTVQQIRDAFDARFGKTRQVRDMFDHTKDFYGPETYAAATEAFKGLQVRLEGRFGPYQRGSVLTIDNLQPSLDSQLDPLIVASGDGRLVYLTTQDWRRAPLDLAIMCDSLTNGAFTEETAEFYVGRQVRTPYDIPHLNVLQGDLLTIENVECALDEDVRRFMITLASGDARFIHNHPLRPENAPERSKDRPVKAITFTLAQTADIKRSYKSGNGLHAIANQYGCSAAVIRNQLLANDVTLRGRGRPLNIAKAYKTGAALDVLAARTGFSQERIKKTLTAKGIKIRKPGRPAKKSRR